jgi:hypothetical protein
MLREKEVKMSHCGVARKEKRCANLKEIKMPAFAKALAGIVGVRRLELPASTSRTWRASQLRYTPKLFVDLVIC